MVTKAPVAPGAPKAITQEIEARLTAVVTALDLLEPKLNPVNPVGGPTKDEREDAVEKIVLLREQAKHAHLVVSNVPSTPDGILAAISLTQTYVMVTEPAHRGLMASNATKKLGELKTYEQARKALIKAAAPALRTISGPAPPPSSPTDKAILDLIETTKALRAKAKPTPTDLQSYFHDHVIADLKVLNGSEVALSDAQVSEVTGAWEHIINRLVLPTNPNDPDSQRQDAARLIKVRDLVTEASGLMDTNVTQRDSFGFIRTL